MNDALKSAAIVFRMTFDIIMLILIERQSIVIGLLIPLQYC
jgi:hypothetical protein